MSDPTNPAAPAQDAPQGAPASAPAQTPAPVAAAPQAPSEAPARPTYVNPWKGRAPAPVAPAAAAPTAQTPPTSPDPIAALRADVEGLRGIIGRTVEQDLAAVPANVAAAVRGTSSDPIEQRRILDVLRANGIAPSSTSAPLPAPASTVQPAAPVAPASAAPTSDDAARLAEFEKLQSAAPTFANAYRLTHSEAISRALAARTSTN
jgi:hypothetical protein